MLHQNLHIAKPIIQNMVSAFTEKHHIFLSVKRLDQIHPSIQGNKWYKLQHNITEAKRQGKTILLTFGGAYSNHIYATAAAGKALNLQTIGIIRGEETQVINPILLFAKQNSMQIAYTSRSMYKFLRENFASPLFYEKIKEILLENLGIKNIENIYIIPEGGANDFAVLGCQEISRDIVENQKFDAICCASGTGSTLAGIILGCPSPTVQKIGFAAVKGGEFLETDIKKMIAKQTTQNLDFILQTGYHFGGYAKKNSILTEFIQEFEQTYQFCIEPIYTGKMFFGLFDLIQQGYFAKNSRILAIHTGGIY